MSSWKLLLGRLVQNTQTKSGYGTCAVVEGFWPLLLAGGWLSQAHRQEQGLSKRVFEVWESFIVETL